MGFGKAAAFVSSCAAAFFFILLLPPEAHRRYLRSSPPASILVKAYPQEIALLTHLMRNASVYLEYTKSEPSRLAAMFLEGKAVFASSSNRQCQLALADSLFEPLLSSGQFEVICDEKQFVEIPQRSSLLQRREDGSPGQADLIMIDGKERRASAVFASQYMHSRSIIVYRNWSDEAAKKLSDIFEVFLPLSEDPAEREKAEKMLQSRGVAALAEVWEPITSGRQVKLLKSNGQAVVACSSFGSGNASTALLTPKSAFFERAAAQAGSSIMVADYKRFFNKR